MEHYFSNPHWSQMMRLSTALLCSSLLLISSLLQIHQSAYSAPQASYAQQIEAAYKAWSKNPRATQPIQRTSDPNVEANQLRATLMMGTDVRQETKFKLLKRLSDAEKSSGANSVKLVPILLQLAAVPGTDNGPAMLQRAISIANSATLAPDKASDNLAAAEWLSIAGSPETFFVVNGGSGSGAAILTDDLRESMLKTSFKLALNLSGLTDDTLNTLFDLCDMYREQKHTDELVAVGRLTLNALSTMKQERAYPMQKSFSMSIARTSTSCTIQQS